MREMYLKGFKPLVVESFRKVVYNNTEYKRRLRINRFNALLLDEYLGTYIAYQGCKFVVLDDEDIKKACLFLGIEYKPISTYFHIDLDMCSFSLVP